MATDLPRPLLRLAYERAAQAYLRSLPLEHFMEAIPQATQREITVESLALVKPRRPDLQYFNELLVLYPFGRAQTIHQVVPDNMVVLSEPPIVADGSYDVPFQPARPFWTLEYVSKSSERKDYEDSFREYERELKVPYYLIFYPEIQELTLFHLRGRKYSSVRANKASRYPIVELEMEVALKDGWARFWYQGQLLPLPADMQRDLGESRRALETTRHELHKARQQSERLLAQLRKLGIEPE